MRRFLYLVTKKCRIYAACGVSQTPNNLYWLKGAKENLRDIMDDIEAEYNADVAAEYME